MSVLNLNEKTSFLLSICCFLSIALIVLCTFNIPGISQLPEEMITYFNPFAYLLYLFIGSTACIFLLMRYYRIRANIFSAVIPSIFVMTVLISFLPSTHVVIDQFWANIWIDKIPGCRKDISKCQSDLLIPRCSSDKSVCLVKMWFPRKFAFGCRPAIIWFAHTSDIINDQLAMNALDAVDNSIHDGEALFSGKIDDHFLVATFCEPY